jgi:hypothetical protein
MPSPTTFKTSQPVRVEGAQRDVALERGEANAMENLQMYMSLVVPYPWDMLLPIVTQYLSKIPSTAITVSLFDLNNKRS